MCMTTESELSYKAMDETAEYAHELHAHVKPETGNTTGSKALDFAAFWFVGRAASVVIGILCLAIVSMLAGWAYQELSMADWSPLLAVIGVAL